MGAIEEAWTHSESRTAALADSSKRIAHLAGRAATAIAEGSMGSARKSIEALAVELGQMVTELDGARESLDRAEALLAAPNALAQEVEAELKLLVPERRMWRSMSEIVVFPSVANVKTGKATIDKTSVASQRPQVIAAAVLKSLEAGTSPERFLKTLYSAVQLVNGGRIEGRVPLTSLFQVLATTPPGAAGYTTTDFRVDLQWLYGSGVRSVGGHTVRFDAASAGPAATPVYDSEGNLVNLGYISFTPTEGTDA